ncbi:uncharacterized protein LOC119108545 [Pollicipes pollicipes]|uniref:uncharacterized protein LOC119108545 n=1 Tax=Pollicipes pollicipes TaxID=41117 RepID=UPI0018854710|nr:uncharacterized protein LOC119108545 [Pollicipes pollicipes]
MERADPGRQGSCGLLTAIALLLLLLPLLPTVSGKLPRDITIRQGGLQLPPLDPALIRGILPPVEIAAFARNTILSRRNRIRDLVSTGVPRLGVGPLDPYQLGEMPVNFTMDVIELAGNITEATARGLSDLQLLDADVHLPGLTVVADARIPLVTVNGRYSLDGSFSGLFPLTGAGPLTLKLKDVDIKLVVQVRLYYDRLHITRVDFTLGIGNTTVNLEGFLKESGFGDLAQQFLDNMSGDFLRNFIKTFREERLPSLVMRGNKFLRDFEWRTMLPNFVALYLGFDDDSGSYHHDYLPTITNNHLVDRIISQLSNNLRGRRVGLPMQDIIARKKVLWKWFRNGVQLFHGQLFGLQNMKRVSNALISRHKEYFTFTIEIGAHHLKAAYKSQLVIMNKLKKFVLWAFISKLKLRVQLQLDAEYMELYLTGLDILHIGEIHLELSGLGPLDAVATNLAERQINKEVSKRLLARMTARDARDAVAKLLKDVDLNAVLAETINGEVYARDPGIVFPDPEPTGNGTDFSSLLESVLGADSDGEDGGGGLGPLIGLLLGAGDDDDDDGMTGAAASGNMTDGDDELAGVDPEILAAFGLSDSGGASAGDSDATTAAPADELADVDPEILAAFGLTSDSGGASAGDSDATAAAPADELADVDPEILAAFGLGSSNVENPAPATAREEGTSAADADSLAGADIRARVPDADTGGSLAGVDAATRGAFGLSPEAPAADVAGVAAAETPGGDQSPADSDALSDVDPEILAAFGLDPAEPAGGAGDVAGALDGVVDADGELAATAAAGELQELLRLAGDSSVLAIGDGADATAGTFGDNAFFDEPGTAAGEPAATEDNNSFFSSRRRRVG